MKKSLGAKMFLPAPVWVIGTYDRGGQPDMLTASWVGVACSAPPSVMVALRETTATWANILAHRAFTVNLPSASRIREVDYFGMASAADGPKLAPLGIRTRRAEKVYAPALEDFPLILECEVRRTLRAGLHSLVLGEVKDVKAEEGILGENGLPRMDLLDPLFYLPADANYYRIHESLGRAFTLGNDLMLRVDATDPADPAGAPPVFRD